MRLVFLGTGTSQGIPVIGCKCDVCQSVDARDKRLRSSVMFIEDGYHLLIDVGPDLRLQMLANDLDDIDAICVSHEHNDHVSGLDDIRPINFRWKKIIPIYTLDRVVQELKRRFHYAFETTYAARPRLTVNEVEAGQVIKLGPLEVELVSVGHGYLDILGFIVNNVAYLTDVKDLSRETMQRLTSCKTVVMSALHKNEHPSHQTLAQALSKIEQINPDRALLTHIAHQMGTHHQESLLLPENVSFAYDGLVLENL